MGDRTPFVVGILAIVGVVAWLLVRDDTPAKRAPKATPAGGSADLTQPRGAIAAPEGPGLPPATDWSGTKPPELPVPPTPTADEVFSEEPRDDAWAAKTEAELDKRWKKIRAGKLERVECRQTQCRLLVTGAQSDVATAVGDLEGSRGLHGFARNVHLTSPETRADGSIALHVFVRFDR